MKNETQELRAHHTVPQCWLAGFTDSGEKDSKLWVTDLKRNKQWGPITPENVGHRRDFYRISDPLVEDPVVIEKMFSSIESSVAPVLRNLNKEKRGPRNGDELGHLVEYMCIQWIRVPAFRTLIDRTTHAQFSKLLISPKIWEEALHKSGIPMTQPGADYGKMLEATSSGQITFSAVPEFYLKQGANIVEDLGACFRKMHWGVFVSETGNFIGSDNPVALDGEAGGRVGYKNAEVVVYPVCRHVALYGTRKPAIRQRITMELIAHQNTFAMLTADEQVYSHRPDFHWLDSSGKCQNDWRLFSKKDFYPTQLASL